MKKNYFIAALMLITNILFAQQNVGIGTSNPGSSLQVSGSFATQYTVKTAGYTLCSADYFVAYNGTGTATFSLPQSVPTGGGNYNFGGRIYVIKNTTAGQTLIISPYSNELIDGAGSITVSAGNTITIVNNGNVWTSGSAISTWNVTATSAPTLNAGSGISVTGTYPDLTIANTSPSLGGTVTSVNGAGGGTGLTLTGGPITTSGTLTLGGTLDIGNGGTGQTTQQAAINALTGTQSSGTYLRSNGTNSILSAIQAGDVPVLNQNTTGNASTATTATSFSGYLSGDVTGTQSATTVGALQGKTISASAPSDAQNLVYNSSTSKWTPVSISGDATMTNAGAVSLKNTGTAGSYGSATQVPVLTTDAQGRVTGVTPTTITGTSPVGSALTSTEIWVGNPSNQAAAVAMSGDVSIGNTGTVTLSNTAGARSDIGLGTGNSPVFTGQTLSGLSAAGIVTNTSGGVLGTEATIPNSQLTYNSITISNGTGMTGGGTVALGGTITHGLANGSAAGQIFVTGASPYTPALETMTGDATISSAGVLALKNTGSAGTYGSATQVPVLTTDAQGRITSVTNTTITGTVPGGSASGDLSGTYPGPAVAKINGSPLGTTTGATTGDVLQWNGSAWAASASTGITGSGTVNVHAKFGAGGISLTNSIIQDNGTSISVVGNSSPSSAAILDLTNTGSLGFLLPSAASAPSSPPAGLVVYNSSTGCAQVYTGLTSGTWTNIGPPATAASISNSGSHTIFGYNQAVTFTASATNAVNYTWAFSGSGSITVSGTNNNTLSLTGTGAIGTANSGTITVTAAGCNGGTTTATYVVTFGGTLAYTATGTWPPSTAYNVTTSINIQLWGAGGGSSSCTCNCAGGGAGGYVAGNYTPAQSLTINIGAGGCGNCCSSGGDGGGGTTIYAGANLIAGAGGGGGGSYNSTSDPGYGGGEGGSGTSFTGGNGCNNNSKAIGGDNYTAGLSSVTNTTGSTGDGTSCGGSAKNPPNYQGNGTGVGPEGTYGGTGGPGYAIIKY